MSISNIPIEKIRPNPYQPESRIKVTPEDAKRFGESILKFGMILTPVGRRSNGFFEMGDGWLRLAGHRWLVDNGHVDYQVIRFEEKELSDQQMADLVIEANKTRKDLNPIEEAYFYSQYIKDFKVTQEELAKKYNISQGELANTLRLLDLPEPVQEKVISHEISAGHGRQLLRLNKQPQIQKDFVDSTIKHGFTVNQLDTEINRKIYDTSKSLTKESYPKPVFDTKECESCESRVMVANPWGQQKKGPRCLNTACWEKKQKTAEAAEAARVKARLAKKSGGAKILTDKDLNYDQYEKLNSYYGSYRKILDNPDECETCKQRGLYLDSYAAKRGDDPAPVCLDKACFRAKKTRKTKADNKAAKIKDKDLTLKLGELFEKHNKNRYGSLVLAFRFAISSMSATVRDDIAAMFPDIVPKFSNGRMDPDALKAQALTLAEPVLVKLLSAILVSKVRRDETYNNFSPTISAKVRRELSIIEGTYESVAAGNIEFQVANCTGCDNANPSLINTGEDCCKWTHNRKLVNGVCQSSPNKDKLQPPKQEKKPKAEKKAVESKPVEDNTPPELPEGLRFAKDVPESECEGCGLATEDHTIGHKFLRGNVSYKVCIKDYRAWQKKQELEPVTAGAGKD